MLDYWYIWIIAGLLVAITAGFVIRFIQPAIQLRRELGKVIGALQALGSTAQDGHELRQHLSRKVMAGTSFVHLWLEYAQTLHQQQLAGQSVRHWRATALAETFFTDQALVDTPLKTEYYKHLPGIMTGLGIIGTFTGLITGLSHFDVSIEPVQAQAQLRNLINAVGHAFIVSAIAITLAMIFTWIEKSLVTACYRLTEQMRQHIDSLFETGADVEYLERLVTAAEISATDVEQLKLALAEQTRLLIESGERNSARLSADLGRELRAGLAQPIADIAQAVTTVGARQDEVVTTIISDVVSGFSQQMENMFAGRMLELQGVLSHTNGSMREMVDQFSAMAGRMVSAGKEAVESMSARLEASVALTEERQLAQQRHLGAQAEQLRTVIVQSQTESAASLQQLLASLTREVNMVVNGLQHQAATVAGTQTAQIEQLTQSVSTAVGGLSLPIETLVQTSIATNQKLQETIAALARSTGDAIRGMNEGAEKLGAAAKDFAVAGQHVSTTVDESSKASEKVRLAANAMQKSAEASQHMLGDYSQSQSVFSQLLADLNGTIDRAKREASLSAEITDQMASAASKLSHAQLQADVYLEGVSKVLGHAHQAFAESVEQTLREANRQFQSELAQAVGLLSGAIVDLGETVEALAEQGRS